MDVHHVRIAALTIDLVCVGKDCLHYCQGAGYCTLTGMICVTTYLQIQLVYKCLNIYKYCTVCEFIISVFLMIIDYTLLIILTLYTSFIFTITLGECQCDSGITAPSCPTRNNYPQTIITDFDNPTNTMPLPVVYGAELSTDCGTLSSGRSLVFKYISLASLYCTKITAFISQIWQD